MYPTSNQSIDKVNITLNTSTEVFSLGVSVLVLLDNFLDTLADQNKPVRSKTTWIIVLSPVMFTIRLVSVTPNKCQPHPNGSFSTVRTRLSLGNANETVKAIQAINPNGSSTCAWVAMARLGESQLPGNFCPVHTARTK